MKLASYSADGARDCGRHAGDAVWADQGVARVVTGCHGLPAGFHGLPSLCPKSSPLLKGEKRRERGRGEGGGREGREKSREALFKRGTIG